MQLMVTGRNVDITDPIRTHIEKKLGKIKKYFDHIIDVHVVLSVEKYRQFAEITISGGDGINYHSRETTDDVYVSIDKAVEKIERQLRRRTTKIRKAKRQKAGETREAKRQMATGEAGTKRRGAETPPEQPGPEDTASSPDRVETHGPYRVHLSDKFAPKPMSVEEAIMQLDASEDDFLAFVHDGADEVSVVFKRREGDYGLLRRPF